jgi:hypothetical protein
MRVTVVLSGLTEIIRNMKQTGKGAWVLMQTSPTGLSTGI